MRLFHLTISRPVHQVLTATILEQIFEIEFLVQYTQCSDCTRLAAKNTWKALVQVRQKVSHKRTFLFLEQLILKHGAQKDTISVKEVKDGLDFFYSQKSHAVKMTEFLTGSVPVRWVYTLVIFRMMLNPVALGRSKASEQLLSTDTHSNTANFKYTFSVEIAPICKDDLVCIPPRQARSLGNISPLTVCTRVGNSIHLLDPQTLQFCDVTAPIYWRTPFFSLASVTDLVEFTVLDIEPSGPVKGKWVLADAQVALSGAFRSTGNNGDDVEMDYELASSTNQIFHTRTHLGDEPHNHGQQQEDESRLGEAIGVNGRPPLQSDWDGSGSKGGKLLGGQIAGDEQVAANWVTGNELNGLQAADHPLANQRVVKLQSHFLALRQHGGFACRNLHGREKAGTFC